MQGDGGTHIFGDMEYKDRLKAARKHARLTQGQLAEAIGITQTSISDLERGKSKGTTFSARIARACGVSALWLEDGLGEMLAQGEHSNITPVAPPQRETRQYPVISWVAAGARRESGNCYADGVAEELVGSTENAGPNGYWLQVKGRSMTCSGYPTFPEGCLILVQPEGFELVSGRFYIAQHRDGEATFKQYVYDAGHEYLVPLNPDFETVRMDEHWEIIGRVVDAKITGL